MSTYAVIGASRGIGLEFVRQLAARPGATVFAVVRSLQSAGHLAGAVSGLSNVYILEGDVGDYAALESAAKKAGDISGGKLDCLIHDAALIGGPTMAFGLEDFSNMDALDTDFIHTFRINTLGFIHSVTAFLPLLRASTAPTKKIIVISAAAADPNYSLKLGEEGATLAAYAITKAATNVAATKWAVRLKDEGFVVVALSPGLVDTTGTMGEPGEHHNASDWFPQFVKMFEEKGINLKSQTAAESVSAQLRTIDELTPEKTGLFLSHDGSEWVL